ncbi:ABC-2 family transporter protein [Tissierella praeacuta DSM 18095]|uniref:ABC-2 family transporter protein n=1 Tax=Tissierella praeacuta DSM 18095 TaxID=1123404 RepID=A0A1M4TT98_9FIRM|nr:ABC-2 transporter permease [Tissierella praeacuta]SHE47729.1 ABC-2 family transporter protein [Tissierella praeacuta DSM 18095]SUP04319.1 ABC-2 family transporter protein [Tissierella praeacuta]
MKHLIMKDIRLLRIINLIIFWISLIFGCVGVSTENIYKSKLIYGFSIFIMIYIVSIFSTQHELKAKSDMMLNSFPVNRYDIVRAKYISMGIYIFAISGIVFISSNLFKIMMNGEIIGSPATIFDVLFIIGFSLMFFSIYLPFQYYSIGKAQAFSQIFYIFLIILPNIIGRFGSKIETANIFKNIIVMDFGMFIFMFAVVGIILYLISLEVSKKIYSMKEF